MKATVPQEMYYLVSALAVAVDSGFMSRDHAANIWKSILKVSGFDVAKQMFTRKEENYDTTEKSQP